MAREAVFAGAKRRFPRRLRLAIDGADVLADVASEDPVADERAQVPRNGASQFDGEK